MSPEVHVDLLQFLCVLCHGRGVVILLVFRFLASFLHMLIGCSTSPSGGGSELVTYAALVWRVRIGLGPPFWGIEITSSGPRKMSFGVRQSFVVRHGIPNDIKEIRR